MKKLKLIPGLILLALCLAVLGVGIYAAAPASNTITGTVSVTAANAEVEISVYENYYNPGSPATNRLSTGTTRSGLELSMGSFNFDASGANTKYDVPLKEIILVVKNHSTTQDLGMYFWNTANNYADSVYIHSTTNAEAGFVAGTVPQQAEIINDSGTEYSDILYGHHKYASTNAVADVVDVEYEFYKHLPVAADTDSDSDIDETDYTARAETIRMYIRLDKMVESNVTVNLNVHLNIEKYVPNYANDAEGFVKVGPDQLTGTPKRNMPTAYDEGLTHLTLPYGTTAITYCFGGTSLSAIGIPSGVTEIEEDAFYDCASLTAIVIPSSVTSIESYAFQSTGLTSIVVPGSVSVISEGMFSGCTSLATVVLRSGVTKIDYE